MKNGEPLSQNFSTVSDQISFDSLQHNDTGNYQCIAVTFQNVTSAVFELLVNCEYPLLDFYE